MLQWLSADSCSACCLPGPPGPLQQGASHTDRSCPVLFGYFVPGAAFWLVHTVSASEDASPLWQACLASQLGALSKLPKRSFLFCLNFQLLTSFKSHILPNTWMSPLRFCVLCSPVQKLSLTVDGLDRAGHPGCLGSLLELHMTAEALHSEHNKEGWMQMLIITETLFLCHMSSLTE